MTISITPRGTLAGIAALGLATLAACMSPAPSSLGKRSTAAKRATTTASPTDTDGDTDGDTAADDTDGDGADTSAPSSPSASSSSSSSSGSSGSSGVTPQACLAAASSPGDGRHHAGESCGRCHDSMGSAAWTVSGTVFASGGVGVAGATIEIVDAAGKTLRLTTCDNGNFYTTTAVTMPLTVRSSRCPSNAPMVAKVSDGSCNGCHGSNNPIHL